MKQALIIGSTVVDVTVRLPHLPVTGEDVIVENQSMSLGGCAYNVSEILRQSGVPYILFSPVGTGIYGDYVREHMEKKQIPVWIRHVVVPGITDREEYLYRLGRYLGTLKNVKALDVLPYHDMGKAKYHQLGIPYPLEDTAPLPPAKAAEYRKIILQGMRDERTHCS